MHGHQPAELCLPPPAHGYCPGSLSQRRAKQLLPPRSLANPWDTLKVSFLLIHRWTDVWFNKSPPRPVASSKSQQWPSLTAMTKRSIDQSSRRYVIYKLHSYVLIGHHNNLVRWMECSVNKYLLYSTHNHIDEIIIWLSAVVTNLKNENLLPPCWGASPPPGFPLLCYLFISEIVSNTMSLPHTSMLIFPLSLYHTLEIPVASEAFICLSCGYRSCLQQIKPLWFCIDPEKHSSFECCSVLQEQTSRT